MVRYSKITPFESTTSTIFFFVESIQPDPTVVCIYFVKSVLKSVLKSVMKSVIKCASVAVLTAFSKH